MIGCADRSGAMFFMQWQLKVLTMISVYALTLSASATGASKPADPRDQAYAAKTLAEAQSLLGVGNPGPGNKMLLEAPDIVDGSAKKGAKVTIRLKSALPGTDWMALLLERGPAPLVIYKDFSPGADQVLEAQVTLSQTTKVRAIARAAGKFYLVTREIKVAEPVRGTH